MFDEAVPGPETAALLARVQPAALSSLELVSFLAACERQTSWTQSVALAAAAELLHREPFSERRREVAAPPSDWHVAELASTLTMSQVAAGRRLLLAAATRRLPGSAAALAAGAVDLPRFARIVEHTDPLADEDALEVERRVLRRAGRQTPGQLGRSLARAVLAVYPAGAADRYDAETAKRRLELRVHPDAMGELWLHTRALDAVAVWNACDEVAHQPTPAIDTRSMDARRADALVDLVLGRVTPQARRPLVQVITNDAEQVEAAAPASAELVGYGPILPPLAEDVAERPGARVRRVGLSDLVAGRTREEGSTREAFLARALRPLPSQVLPSQVPPREVGVAGCSIPGCLPEQHYRPSRGLQERVRLRDRTCRFPGCSRTARRCDLDHVLAYPHGPTCVHNLAALCRTHHRLKGAGLWTVTAQAAWRLRWTSPTGRVHVTDPEGLDGFRVAGPAGPCPDAEPAARTAGAEDSAPPDATPSDPASPDSDAA